LLPTYQATELLAAGKLHAVLTKFEPEPVPVHIVHREGRAAARRPALFTIATLPH
jgi:hypothetical protein